MITEKLTARDRITISNAIDDLMADIMNARELLIADIVSEHCYHREQRPVGADIARQITLKLRLINDILWRAETEYSLMMGNENTPATSFAYEAAERALLVRRVEKLRNKLPFRETAPYCQLPDEKALPILLDIARKNGIREEDLS